MTIQTIPLNKITPPAVNPRRAIDPTALEGLAQSIKADGLLQNLVVRKKGRKFEIISGERRYRALSLLAEQGHIEADHPVPVEVRAKVSADDALRLATVENVQRVQLAPMDEAEAFARMVTDGAELADVAAKAGVSEATVKRRLAIAALCDEAKEAVRSGDVPLSVAEAMTLGTADQQREVLARFEAGYHYDAEDVRGWLTDAKPSVALAIFPLEKYSGTVTSDLFGDDDSTYFDDAEQFLALQAEAVEALAEQHRQNGAAFVEVVTDYHVSWWQYEVIRDSEDGEDDEAETDQPGGVVIHFPPSARVEVREGLRKRPVRQSVTEAVAEGPAPVKPKPEYTTPLLRHMAAHKSIAVMEALLANPRTAKEVAIVQMMQGYDYVGRMKLDPHPALGMFAVEDDQPTAYLTIAREAEETASALGIEDKRQGYTAPSRGAWETLLCGCKDPVALYEAVKALSDSTLDQLHVLLTALSFGQGNMDVLDTSDSLFNRVAADLDVRMRDHWRPDAAFLSRRSKEQLAAIARESGAAACLGGVGSYKKGELVKALERFFTRAAEGDEKLPSDAIEKANAWLPGGMAFPAVSADAPQPEGEPETGPAANDEQDDEAIAA